MKRSCCLCQVSILEACVVWSGCLRCGDAGGGLTQMAWVRIAYGRDDRDQRHFELSRVGVRGVGACRRRAARGGTCGAKSRTPRGVVWLWGG